VIKTTSKAFHHEGAEGAKRKFFKPKEPLINSLKRHLPRCGQAQNTHLLRVNSVFSPVRALHLLA
jgi:hypothetical protein